MRISAWCLGFALIACGESERHSFADHQGAGGIAPTAGTGGSTAAASGSGGTGGGASGTHGGGAPTGGTAGTAGTSVSAAGGSDTGGREASGGVGASAGSGGGSSGSSASAGDGSSAAGEAGSAGAAGAPTLECAGEYDACGCGCCGGTTPSTVCYYPDRGDSLDTIKSDDQATAMSSSCATAGCSLGMHYVCCATPSEPAPAKSYDATGGMVSTDLYRITLHRTGADDRCQRVHLARGDGPAIKDFPISLPDGWILEVLQDSTCADENSADASKFRSAIGGFGWLGFVGTGSGCSLTFNFTLFFASATGGVDAVYFQSGTQSGPVVAECG